MKGLQMQIGSKTQAMLSLVFTLAISLSANGDNAWSFTSVDVLDTQLHRGVSTKQDVLLLVGEPSGRGEALIPMDTARKEVWYYEDIKVEGLISPSTKQQVLLVFFNGDRYDGYLWFSNDIKVKM